MRFLCHPALEQILEQSKVAEQYQHSSLGTTFISSYLPQYPGGVHSGLIQAVTFRLAHPTGLIVILSFHAKEALMSHDTHGILSLYGTEFLRLPFSIKQLHDVLDAYQQKDSEAPLLIPEGAWQQFAEATCKALLTEKLRVLNHGNKLDFVNHTTGPLKSACIDALSLPFMYPVVQEELQYLRSFVAQDEIAELLSLANVAHHSDDTLLQRAATFAAQLQRLVNDANQETLDLKKLIFVIDNVNEALSQLQNH
ncbi:MAG: hypothetical protein U0Y10_04570 [Spirosomataceae bacterium]